MIIPLFAVELEEPKIGIYGKGLEHPLYMTQEKGAFKNMTGKNI